MKKKYSEVFDFISREVGIEFSPHLKSLILNPQKVSTLNNIALEQIVKEFAPIYKKYRYILDGPKERLPIVDFEISLLARLNNKPELQKYLDDYSRGI